MTLPGPFVGRVAEVDVLHQALMRLEAGEGGIVCITGEQGIGKSAILEQTQARARERNFLVFAARGVEPDRCCTNGLFVDALDDYVASLDERELARLREGREELATVFPALASGRSANATASDARYDVHRAMRSLLEELSLRRPVVLVLDDLHWADASSVELVSYLVRRPPRRRVLLLLAFRETQLHPSLRPALDAIEKDRLATRLNLLPLTMEEARLLLDGRVPVEVVGGLYELSGGNPFYLDELARAHPLERPASSSVSDSEVIDQVPPAVHAAIASELEGLSPQARVLVRAAAVAGDPFEVGLAADIAELPPDDLALIDELVVSELIVPTAVPRRFAFRHPILRRAVYQSAGPGWLIEAHARAARALAGQGAPAGARAHHVDLAAAPGDLDAVALLRQAGEEAAHTSPANAARWFEAALRLMPDDREHRSVQLETLRSCAMVLERAGRFIDAKEALLKALRLVDQTETGTRVSLSIRCAAVEHALGQHASARGRLGRALAELPEPVSTDAAALEIELSLDAALAFDLDSMRSHADSAMEVADVLDSLPLKASAAAMLALAGSEDPRPESLRMLDRATELVDLLTDEELASRLDAAHALGWAQIQLDRYDEADRLLARGLRVAEATGSGSFTVGMTLGRAVVATNRGRLEAAAALAERAVDLGRLSGIPEACITPLAVEAWIAALRGDVGGALRAGEESVALARDVEGSYISARAACVLALTRIEAGDFARGRSELLEVGGGAELPFLMTSGLRWIVYEALARADIALGNVEAAREWARRADDAANDFLPLSKATAQRAVAATLLASHEAEAAAEIAMRSAAVEEKFGSRLAACRSRLLAGRALARAGDRTRAIAELERATSTFAECGALRLRDEAARELRLLGKRVPRPARPVGGPGSLSRRELEIAELVTQGKTNREIAADLFLSERTIETHLSRVFDKLGVRSRAAVGAILERTTEALAS